MATTLKRGIVRPIRMLFFSPVIAVFSIYMALIYGLLYLFLTTISSVYINTYGWTPELSGLAFLGIGLGFFLGLVVTGPSSDKIVIKLTKRNNGVYEPEMRLPFMIIFASCIPVSFFWYGWAADKEAHWIVPILGLVPFGAGMIGIFIPIQTYIIDSLSMYSASAAAALTISRSLLGALLPLSGMELCDSLGLGFIALAMIPALYVLWKHGGHIRKRYPIKL